MSVRYAQYNYIERRVIFLKKYNKKPVEKKKASKISGAFASFLASLKGKKK